MSQIFSMSSANLGQSSSVKFHMGHCIDWVKGISMPVVIKIGLCCKVVAY